MTMQSEGRKQMGSTERIFPELGRFFVGCNYWASHAGTAMWRDWQPAVVEKDLQLLAKSGIQVLRVFPLWPDFQPIHRLYGGGGVLKEYRFSETEELPGTEAGRAGVSELAMARFREFADLAEKHGLKLVVGLITGHMSGRLHVPPAVEGLDIITDKTAIMWQVRFAKYFVKTMKDSQAILAWDLGNECNCMQGHVEKREDAWVWTAAISDAVRSMDTSRPLVSGMHSLTPAGTWTMQDQGELTDILTTHPYPYWTPYTDFDPIDTIRPVMHAAAESVFYSDMGNKPCFVEEIGNMGPMVADDDRSAAFARASLLNIWANGCHGFVWWCAFNQNHLTHPPYDWAACESELGLVTVEGKTKPVLKEMARLKQMIESLPCGELPARRVDGICILNTYQNHWGVAYSAFILAKQAGFDIGFQFEDQPLRDAPFYLIPCIRGTNGVPKRKMTEVLKKVEQGAVLYISMDDGYIEHVGPVTGNKVKTRSRRSERAVISIPGEGGPVELNLNGSFRLDLEPERSEVLAAEADGNPVLTSVAYGKGRVYFLSMPVESDLVQRPGVFNNSVKEPYWKIYAMIARESLKTRIISKDHPLLAVTEHPADKNSAIGVLINCGPEALTTTVLIDQAWTVDKVLYGDGAPVKENGFACRFRADDGVVLSLRRRA